MIFTQHKIIRSFFLHRFFIDFKYQLVVILLSQGKINLKKTDFIFNSLAENGKLDEIMESAKDKAPNSFPRYYTETYLGQYILINVWRKITRSCLKCTRLV